jgi:hypothetical protein
VDKEQKPRQIQRGRGTCTVLAPSSLVKHPTLVVAAFLLAGCAPAIKSTLGRTPTSAELAAFWVEPAAARDTVHGSGGPSLAPRPDIVYKLLERKGGGFSPKLEVEDPDGVKWSIKMGDEAQPEVTCSRILWAAGYQQPPEYYLRQWQVHDEVGVHPMGPARFRPHLHFMKSRGSWAWRANPFVESVQFRGLLVVLLLLNSSDLKDENNEIFEVQRNGDDPETWYTVKDLGSSLGQTGWVYPKRNDIGFFEEEGFITGVEKGYVRFAFKGHFKDLIRHLTPADVRWACSRLQRLTPVQWRDAFAAGGYDDVVTARYLRKIEWKIAQGLSLGTGGRS